MIRAVIFDMDGVLIDSEPFWRRAEEKVFQSIGISGFKAEMARETTGLRIDHTVEYWHRRFPWTSPSKAMVARMIVEETTSLIKKEGKIKEGALEAIRFFIDKKMKIALASSSPQKMINIVLEKLGIHYHFKLVHSAEFESNPKPHPDVFITVSRKLLVKPSECLVIEDSPRGIEAAINAGMKCIAIPDKHHENNKIIYQADCIINSLIELNEELWRKISQI